MLLKGEGQQARSVCAAGFAKKRLQLCGYVLIKMQQRTGTFREARSSDGQSHGNPNLRKWRTHQELNLKPSDP